MIASMTVAVAAGSPLAVGVALNSEDFISTAYLVTAIVVSLASIGTVAGKIYAKWKASIEANVHRDDLLEDLCGRVKLMEERQLMIIEHLDRIIK